MTARPASSRVRSRSRRSSTVGGTPLRFGISADAFFQTNTEMAERLYAAALQAAALSGRERVFDLYCGIGTISLALALDAGDVVGVESVERAVADAIENARVNGVDNARFYAGDVRTAMRPLLEEEGSADVVVIDPPRAGLSQKVVRRVLEVEAKKIVYVSCNPTTLAPNARQIVDAGYELEPVTPGGHVPADPAHRMRRVLLAALIALAATAPATAHAAAPKRPPVVMIVLDEFPLADIQRADGRIDRERFPGFAALAAGSTWFPNAYAVHDSTHFAVPAILTGLAPRPGRDSPSYLAHPRSLFTYLDRLGYAIHSREEATTVCPPRLCPRADRYGNPHYNILHRRRERLDHTIASLRRSRRPTLTFHHSVLPHVPWAYLPSGQARTGYRDGALPDFASPSGFGDEFLTEFNEQRHLLQAGFADAEVGRLVARLKKAGLWKDALVVVTADQAISFQVGSTDRRQVTRGQRPRGGAGAAVRQAPGPDARGRLALVRHRPGHPAHDRGPARPPARMEGRRRQRVRPRRAGAPRGAHAAPGPVRRHRRPRRADGAPASARSPPPAATCSATAAGPASTGSGRTAGCWAGG